MKLKLTIPTSLSEITLFDYQKYVKIATENEDAVDFVNLKLVEIFCKIKLKDINNINVKDFESILGHLVKTFEEPKKHVERFEMGGVEYGFIPSLKKDTLGINEYVDMIGYFNEVENLHKFMAVMYRPIVLKKKDKYLIEEYKGSDEYADIMKFAPLNIVLGAQVFFYNLAKDLIKNTLHSLDLEAVENTELKKVFQESGVGITQFTHLLEGTSLN